MKARSIKTHKIKSSESIYAILDRYITKLTEKSIIAISSKIVSTCENRIVNTNKKDLINKESDFCFKSPINFPGFHITLKNNRLIPNAGIDESNCTGSYILLPKNPMLSAKKIWKYLRKNHTIKNLGVIITDSNITPLRAGVTGITLGWCGFKPTYNYIGQKDVFGRIMEVTQINLLDSLATIATLEMGEGKEQTPMAIITNAKKINFQNNTQEKEAYIDPKSDLFSTVNFRHLI